MDEPGERWVIEVKPFPDDERPVGRRVAALLKYAKRECGLKCVLVRDPDEQKTESVEGDSQ